MTNNKLWKEGTIGIPGEGKGMTGKATICHYWVKSYEEPSEYGIDEGRISKLEIRIHGKIVCRYDRGWDIEPSGRESEIALAILMQQYN